MKVYEIIKKTLTPMLWLNGILAAVGGVFLILENQWGLMWSGGLMLMLYPVVFPILMVPGTAFAGLSAQLDSVRPQAARVLMTLAIIYFTGALAGYTAMSFNVAASAMQGKTLLPAVSWAIGVAVLPWALLTTKDRDNVFFLLLLILMQSSAFLAAFFGLRFHLGLGQSFLLMWGLMAAMMLVFMASENKKAKKETISS